MVDLGPDVRALLAQAERAARKRGEPRSSAHLLLAMLESQADVGRMLEGHGATRVSCHQALASAVPEPSSVEGLLLERSRRLAEAAGEKQVSPQHLLLSLLHMPRSEATRCLSAMGVGLPSLERALRGVPESTSRPAARAARAVAVKPLRTLIDWEAHRRGQNARAKGSSVAVREARAGRARTSSERSPRAPRGDVKESAAAPASVSPWALDPAHFPLLAALGRNLSQAAAEGRLDPVVGRDAEVEQVLDVLARRRANNPILVGPPGVGKTAIAEALAQRLLVESSHGLAGRTLIELSAGSLVAGANVRGAVAERVAKLRKEVAASEGRVLLFIDEIHALVGGGSDGPDDLANELKAALARGELPCVGATTESEYRKVFERDQALARRFSRVVVAEPSRDACLTILTGVVTHYERYHRVAYERDAVSAAVDLSVRYLPALHLPDKAVSILDLAGARCRRRGQDVVDRAAVAAAISERAGVPVERLLMRDQERLLALEQRLGERVIGQDAALRRVSAAIRRGAVGLRGRRPLGVFLLLGSTGVGKTELAKALAEELFQARGMTRLDMSEYTEPHAVARLFGAPPGYVGHEDGGQLTEAVRNRPYQLLLLDEIEKAHPDVLLALLPLLDEGRLTDGRGRTIDFTNTVIAMTSNLGAGPTRESAAIGFGRERVQESDAADRMTSAVRARLPPELFARIDEVVPFVPLSRAAVLLIAQSMLQGVARALEREQGLHVEIEAGVAEHVVAKGGFDAALGARPLRAVVAREVENQLAELVLSGHLARGERVRVSAHNGAVQVFGGARPLALAH